MQFCNKCGSEVKDDTRFCNKCGNKLRQIVPHKEAEHKSQAGLKGRCTKCGAKLLGGEGFCGECGHERTEAGVNALSKISPAALPWVILICVLIVAGIILIPTKTIAYQIDIPYIDKEQYTVEVPYEDVEEYAVQVPYETKEEYVESIPVQEQENIKYKKEWAKCAGSVPLFYDGEATLRIMNLDDEGGEFTVRVGYLDESGQFVGTRITKFIPPHFSSVDFTYSPTPMSSFQCSGAVEQVPIKTRTERKDVIKQRTTTKYRDETRYRKVQKTRTETREREVRKTKAETRYKQVNWLFGFEAPW